MLLRRDFLQSVKAAVWCVAAGLIFTTPPASAVENGTNSSFNTAAPTSSDIPNWTTGWAQPAGQTGITGWNYVGTVAGGGGGASGVYLGNNWVITAGHVGPGTFTLNGTAYSVVSGSAQSFSNSNGTADISLFQIASGPNLPPLSIATSAPQTFGLGSSGSQVAMIGYGGGQGETWGLNTVTQNNQLVGVNQFVTTDFETNYGITPGGTNNYFFVVGDSGGGDFIFNSSTGSWQLAGLNEAVDTSNNNSYMVQLSTYAPQINAIVPTPKPSPGVFLACAVLAVLGGQRWARPGRSRI